MITVYNYLAVFYNDCHLQLLHSVIISLVIFSHWVSLYLLPFTWLMLWCLLSPSHRNTANKIGHLLVMWVKYQLPQLLTGKTEDLKNIKRRREGEGKCRDTKSAWKKNDNPLPGRIKSLLLGKPIILGPKCFFFESRVFIYNQARTVAYQIMTSGRWYLYFYLMLKLYCKWR